jgi:hypothetical protein
MNRFSLMLFAVCLTVLSTAGDVLILTNEMMFEGKVVKIKGCSIIFKTEDAKYIIPASDIYSIHFENVEDKVYTDYMAMSDPNKCLNGRLDAEFHHGKKGGHFILGALFGPFAMLGTAIANPTPEKGRKTYMLSQNKDQFSDPEYLSCYKKKAKGQLLAMEALGWAAWILVVVAISS